MYNEITIESLSENNYKTSGYIYKKKIVVKSLMFNKCF